MRPGSRMRPARIARLCSAIVALTVMGGLSAAQAAPAAGATSGAEPAARSATGDAWKRLDELRQAMIRAGVLTATFRQTFTPAGFTAGDTESGQVWLGLPDCLRWDYREPDPKGFLLCGAELHSWIPGDAVGQRTRVDPTREAGLDLLLLPLASLAERYTASLEADGAIRLVGKPAPGGAAQGVQQGALTARLAADRGYQRLTAIDTTDGEGSHTRFEFGPWTAERDRVPFDPPALDWAEDGQR
jgi:outer membrane lipoprotein carrier protein